MTMDNKSNVRHKENRETSSCIERCRFAAAGAVSRLMKAIVSMFSAAFTFTIHELIMYVIKVAKHLRRK